MKGLFFSDRNFFRQRKGKIEGMKVFPIEPYSQVTFHLGYEFDENDVHDVKLLCETFYIEIPK